MPSFRRVTIIGLGLIGGSLGLAIKRRRLASWVIGYSRRISTVHQAAARGLIDAGVRDLGDAVGDSELVIIATPVAQIVPIAQRVARLAAPGTIIIDVGSAKGEIVRRLQASLPERVSFVGAHPLAGSERRGLAAAVAQLFDGSICILTPTPRTNRAAFRRVRSFWQSLGTRVVVMSPAAHDKLVATISHLPHALAFALMHRTTPQAARLASRSFLDATRVAASDPQLWQEILLMNRRELQAALRGFERELRALRAVLVRGDARALTQWIRAAQRRRLACHALR